MDLNDTQAAVLNAFLEAMCGAIDDMPDFARHMEALEAAGIDLREINVRARIKVNAAEQSTVPTGVQMPLPSTSPEDLDAAFLRGLRIVPDFAPVAEQPGTDQPRRRSWWQRLHGGC